jgi:hypothetical protein
MGYEHHKCGGEWAALRQTEPVTVLSIRWCFRALRVGPLSLQISYTVGKLSVARAHRKTIRNKERPDVVWCAAAIPRPNVVMIIKHGTF